MIRQTTSPQILSLTAIKFTKEQYTESLMALKSMTLIRLTVIIQPFTVELPTQRTKTLW